MSDGWFNPAFAWQILPQLLQATVLSVTIVLLGFAASVAAGLPLLFLRRAPNRAVAGAANLFMEFVRSTPLLVQIYFFYFVLPTIGVRLAPVTTGVLALTVHYSCYMSEIYRSLLDGIPRGQWDATTALGFSRQDSYRRIILPQTAPYFVPLAGNLLIYMIKDTPLLASIGVADIMFVAKGIGADTFQYVEPVTICGVIFLVLSAVTTALVRLLQVQLGTAWLERGAHG